MLTIVTLFWIGLILATGKSVLRIVSGHGKDHDAMAFSYALVALVMLGFNLRWLIAPNGMLFLDIMRLFGCALAGFLIYVVRYYKKWG